MHRMAEISGRNFALAGLCLVALSTICPSVFAQRTPLRPEDQLSVRDIVDAQLAPNGREAIYVMHEADLQADRFEDSIWRVATQSGSAPVRLAMRQGDGSPQWCMNSRCVGFLSSREGSRQVWILNLSDGSARAVTHAPAGVISFAFSPDGTKVAFVAAEQAKSDLDTALNTRKSGVVIDKNDFSVYDLLQNQLFLDVGKPSALWIADVDSAGEPRPEPLQATKGMAVVSYQWSPDGRSIAIAARPKPGLSSQRSDIFLYSVPTGSLRPVLSGTGDTDYNNTTSYANPVWSPDSTEIAVLYSDMKDRWAALERIGIFDVANSKLRWISDEDKLELYAPRLRWLRENELLLENTQNANRQLFAVSTTDGAIRPAGKSGGYESNFSFSSNGQELVFVRQSFHDAPELYFSASNSVSPQKLTALNSALSAETANLTWESLHWQSSDGTQVQGWLIKPPDFDASRKYPLLVFVHGGPVAVNADNFSLYSAWPYPFRAFAARGYLVFLPNYRGTGSFGKAFRQPSDIAEIPAGDILSGIAEIECKGFVDTERVGIMGQSHGGWLGPYVMTKSKSFRAASFAEGSAELFSTYGHMPGWLNLNVHEFYYGASPYADPQRYVALSPAFHLAGLQTATLLEYGEQSLAVEGIEFQTALWRAGVPNELVVYPKTGHNIASPVLQLESMNRNLDWFDYWLLGKRNPAPEKQSEYERWEHMAAEMARMRASTSASH
jgi:dipeptidyl aminopeptidase/acylaminoacyl peptidase